MERQEGTTQHHLVTMGNLSDRARKAVRDGRPLTAGAPARMAAHIGNTLFDSQPINADIILSDAQEHLYDHPLPPIFTAERATSVRDRLDALDILGHARCLVSQAEEQNVRPQWATQPKRRRG